MSIEAWISVAALLVTALGAIATVVATIVANRPRDEAIAIASLAVNHVISGAMILATIAGGVFFWKGYEGTGAILFTANALVYSYFFLRADGSPSRSSIFMLVCYWMMASTITTAGLASKLVNNLNLLISALSKAS